jgi:hypothetical protein
MRIERGERRGLGLQIGEAPEQHGVLEHVGMVAGVEGMAIIHGLQLLRRNGN